MQRILDTEDYIPICANCNSNALEETTKSDALEIAFRKLISIGQGAAKGNSEKDKKESE